MKSLYFNNYGSLENLKLEDVKEPSRKKGHALVRVKAFSLNPRDVAIREGELKFLSGSKFPKLSAADFSGEIVEVDENDSKLKAGDEVFGYYESVKGGVSAEICSIPVKYLLKKSPELSYTEAAALPCTFLTALMAIKDKFRAEPGTKIALYGASGGVGSAALQLSNYFQLNSIAISNSKNEDYCMQQGANEFVAYDRTNVFEDLRNVDYFFQIYSGKGLVYSSAKKVLKKGGKFVCLIPNPLYIFYKLFARPSFDYIIVGSDTGNLDFIQKLVLQKDIITSIEKVYNIEDYTDAYKQLEENRVNGKLVIKL